MAFIYWNQEIPKNECEKLIKEFNCEDSFSAGVGGKLSDGFSTEEKNEYGILSNNDGFIDIRDIDSNGSKKNNNLSEGDRDETIRKS